MSTWNYRIGTYILKYKSNKENKERRCFCMISAYYAEGDINPKSYGCTGHGAGHKAGQLLDMYESPEDIYEDLKLMKLAYNKPILNLDKWPNVYNGNGSRK